MDPYNTAAPLAKASPTDLKSEHDANKALKDTRDAHARHTQEALKVLDYLDRRQS